MPIIFGVGPGIIILFVTWFLVLATYILSSHLKVKLSKGWVLFFAVLLTSIILAIPRQSDAIQTGVEEQVDHFYVWRLFLLFFVFLSIIIAVVVIIVQFGLEQNNPTLIHTIWN